MKRKINIIAIISSIAITTFLFACKKEIIISKKTSKNEMRVSTELKIVELGDIHNIALDYLMENYLFSDSVTIDSFMGRSISILNNSSFDPNIYAYSGEDSANFNIAMTDAYNAGMINSTDSIYTLIEKSSIISTFEKDMINAIKESYMSAMAINDNVQSTAYLKTALDDHITTYSNTSWGEGEGKVVGGYLYIMRASLNYWEVVQPEEFIVVLAQADAAGYLYGWAKSWLGGEPTSNGRINAGVSTAAQFSLVRALSIAIKNPI